MDDFKFNPKSIKTRGYEVIISEGGVTVITDPGCTFYADNNLIPEDTTKLTEEQLNDIANKAVDEWEEFCGCNMGLN